MKIKYNEKLRNWVPDEPINYKKLLNGKISDLKRRIMLNVYTYWLWLYIYPYLSIKKILGFKMKIGFEWLLIYKQEEYINKFAKYKKKNFKK